MGCRPVDFDMADELTYTEGSHVIRYARARSKTLKTLTGVCYWIDGRFQGFTGSEDAVRYWVNIKLNELSNWKIKK